MSDIASILRDEQRKAFIASLPKIKVNHTLKVHILRDGKKVMSGDVYETIRAAMVNGGFTITNITGFVNDLVEYRCTALFYDSDGESFTDLIQCDVLNVSLEFDFNTGIKSADFKSMGRWVKC